MNQPLLPAEVVVRRERLIVGLALASLTALAWAYLVHMASMMPGASMAMPQMHPWNASEVLLLFVMWTIMMVAMMAPAAAPMILIFARVKRQRGAQGGPIVSTAVFLLAYLAVWTAFSAAAAAGQAGLHAAALLSPVMVRTSPLLGGALLLAAGVYQLTPWKRACLIRCRSPLAFLLAEWRDGRRGAFVMGVKHGGYCLGCCWALMGLLFVAGVMNLLWVAAIALFVLVEKAAPRGDVVGRLTASGLVGAGLVLLARG